MYRSERTNSLEDYIPGASLEFLFEIQIAESGQFSEPGSLQRRTHLSRGEILELVAKRLELKRLLSHIQPYD